MFTASELLNTSNKQSVHSTWGQSVVLLAPGPLVPIIGDHPDPEVVVRVQLDLEVCGSTTQDTIGHEISLGVTAPFMALHVL